MYGVLGLANVKIPGGYNRSFGVYNGGSKIAQLMTPDPENIPQSEYYHMDLFFGNLFTTMRLSIGDYSPIAACQYIDDAREQVIFWVIWLITVIITSIIFLNFIVAEASTSSS